MKILFDCSLPFLLAHGGHAIQIQQTTAALQGIGVEVEPLRWWDENQKGDLIHYFCGRMTADQIHFAHQKDIKVVLSELLTGQGSRSPNRLRFQKYLSRAIERVAPRSFTAAFRWEAYRLADAFVALTPWEKHLMEYLFGAAPERTFVVPNGVEEIFFQSPPAPRGSWLVCTATLTERKRVLELAQAAVAAQTPVWIIGRAYDESDPYARNFLELARAQPQWVRFEGPVNDRGELAKIYRAARGFVLLSVKESLSLSALEAAACGCPLLLSDQPWARGTFAGSARFCPVPASTAATAAVLRQFYDAAPQLPAPPRPATWHDVACQLKTIYENVLARRD
jgi:glycosyltransferase involved in cell wall biosynthesis